MSWGYYWRPYVPVAERRRQARAEMARLRKKGVQIEPVEIEGRKIAKTFWGKAWCDHIESFHDYSNRLPRGRTYVRNGSVCHLSISEELVQAKVSGSKIYDVEVTIKRLPAKKWKAIKKGCRGQIGSVLELLQGQLSDHVMRVVTDPRGGLFPLSGEIKFGCSCPDWARMCKHVAAVLYGVGARLDERPELLFVLRGVDQEELIEAAVELDPAMVERGDGASKRLDENALADVFDIDLDTSHRGAKTAGSGQATSAGTGRRSKTRAAAAKKTTAASSAKTTARKTRPKRSTSKTAGAAPGREPARETEVRSRSAKTATEKASGKKTEKAQKTTARKRTTPARSATSRRRAPRRSK